MDAQTENLLIVRDGSSEVTDLQMDAAYVRRRR